MGNGQPSFLDRERGPQSWQVLRGGLPGKARALQGHRAPVRHGHHLQREGGSGEPAERGSKGDHLLRGVSRPGT